MTGTRDRYLDLVRGTSILAVVVGHWLVADLSWDGAQLHDTSALGQVPSLWPLTWLFQVIPLFFCVAGSVNGRSWRAARARGDGYATFVDRRLHRVLVPTAVFLGVVVPAALILDATGGWGVRAAGAMLLQPLWFLAIYLAVVALTPVTLAWHDAWGVRVPVLLVGLAIVSDLMRIGVGLEWAGYVNVLTVWLLVYQLGYFEAEGRLTRRVGAWLAAGGLLATALLTGLGPYPARMVGVPGDQIANMHPPTLAVLGLALAEVGVMVVLRPLVEPWLRRPRVWAGTVWLNLSIMTLYLWHQVALVGAARLLLPLGWPHPVAGSWGWWATHLGLLLTAAMVMAGLIAVFGRFERVRTPTPTPAGLATAASTVVTVVLVGLGLLALAGTRITEPWAVRDVLGGLVAGPLVGVAAVAAAGWNARATRMGRPVHGLLGAGAVLLVAAATNAVGAGPLRESPGAAAVCAVLAGTAVAVAVGVLLLAPEVSEEGPARPARATPGRALRRRAGGR